MQFIYNFKQGYAEGNKDMLDILGGKGANLAEMCNLSIPVPPGFTIIPEASKFFISNKFDSHDKFKFNVQFDESLKNLETSTNSTLASELNPCILSVRSGSKESMPGMMDTILNLGLNDCVVENLIKKTGNSYFAYDSYRRFIQTYGTVVLDIDSKLFEEKLECLETPTSEELKNICMEFKQIIRDCGKRLPSNSNDQLQEAIKAVFNSWYSDRAKTYRQMHGISDDIGTAVNIQAMVFGNKDEHSLTGVLFSRDCLSGSATMTGEYLLKSQCEDIVGGIVTPNPLSLKSSKEIALKIGYSEEDRILKLISLEEINNNLFKDLIKLSKKLEHHYRDVQDIEFTVEDGKLWILQTRLAKKTNRANVIIQKNLFIEGIISEDELLDRTQRFKLEPTNKFVFKNNDDKDKKLLLVGLAVSSGLATGKIVFDPKEAVKKVDQDVILVRDQTDTHDLEGILAAKGTLTAKGGTTSHAAVVCREANLCCVIGSRININLVTKTVQIGDETFKEGDWISLDGDSGEIFKGKLTISQE